MDKRRVGPRGMRWGPLAAGSGIVFVILALVAFFIAGGPEAEATSDEIFEYFADNDTAVKWQGFLFGLSGVFLLWFAGTVASVVRDADPESGGRLRAISLAGAAASAAIYYTGLAAWVALATTIGGNEATPGTVDVAQGLCYLGDMALALSNFTAAVFVGAASIALLRTRLLADWIGWLGLAVAAYLIVNSAVQIFSDSEAASLIGTIAFLAFLAWVLVTSALLARWWAGREVPPEAAPRTS